MLFSFLFFSPYVLCTGPGGKVDIHIVHADSNDLL